MSAEAAAVRSVLIVASALLSAAGLVCGVMSNWHLATAMATSAFLCKWVECWLLERALLAVQLEREGS